MNSNKKRLLPSYQEDFKPKKQKVEKFNIKCFTNCALCKYGAPLYLDETAGWRETVTALFDHFPFYMTPYLWRLRKNADIDVMKKDLTEEEEHESWIYLPDAYAFIKKHWNILCPPQHKKRIFEDTSYRKTLQDTLSHNRNMYFKSGKDIFGRGGFWKMIKRPETTEYNVLADLFLEAHRLLQVQG